VTACAASGGRQRSPSTPGSRPSTSSARSSKVASARFGSAGAPRAVSPAPAHGRVADLRRSRRRHLPLRAACRRSPRRMSLCLAAASSGGSRLAHRTLRRGEHRFRSSAAARRRGGTGRQRVRQAYLGLRRRGRARDRKAAETWEVGRSAPAASGPPSGSLPSSELAQPHHEARALSEPPVFAAEKSTLGDSAERNAEKTPDDLNVLDSPQSAPLANGSRETPAEDWTPREAQLRAGIASLKRRLARRPT
jgi:hypothetical protein